MPIIFQQAECSNINLTIATSATLEESSNFGQADVPNFTLANRYSIAVGDIRMEPFDCNRLEITFEVRNEVQHLNGEFKVFHGGQGCGKGALPTPLSNPQEVIVVLDSKISPCISYSRFEIRTHFTDGRSPKKDYTGHWQAKAFRNCCPHLTSTTTTTSPPTTTATLEENDDPISPTGNITTPLPEAQIGSAATAGIIVGLVLLITLETSALGVFLLKKKKKTEKERRGEVIKTEENNLYGTYAEGPVYNVVTDENDYYGSSNYVTSDKHLDS